jgi:hypothetical protein
LQKNLRKADVRKQVKQNGGRYSVGLLTTPRPLRQASPIPNSAKFTPSCVDHRMVPAMVFLFDRLSIM